MPQSFEADARKLKETISGAIASFEKAYPGHTVKLAYGSDGLNMDIKQVAPSSYTVKAGNTTPLAARKAADGGK